MYAASTPSSDRRQEGGVLAQRRRRRARRPPRAGAARAASGCGPPAASGRPSAGRRSSRRGPRPRAGSSAGRRASARSASIGVDGRADRVDAGAVLRREVARLGAERVGDVAGRARQGRRAARGGRRARPGRAPRRRCTRGRTPPSRWPGRSRPPGIRPAGRPGPTRVVPAKRSQTEATGSRPADPLQHRGEGALGADVLDHDPPSHRAAATMTADPIAMLVTTGRRGRSAPREGSRARPRRQTHTAIDSGRHSVDRLLNRLHPLAIGALAVVILIARVAARPQPASDQGHSTDLIFEVRPVCSPCDDE